MAKKFTYEEVKYFVEVQSNSGCELISKEYKNCKWKMSFICKCGTEFESTFDEFKNGNKKQCNECGYKNGGNKNKKTHEQFVAEIEILTNNEYSVLGKYKGDSIKILMQHDKCGHQWSVVPSSLIQGTRCPICQHRSFIKTTEEFKIEMSKLIGSEYELLEEYRGGEVKVLLHHNKCGHQYYVTPNNFRNGRRCPKCSLPNNPKTEKEVAKILTKLNIKYKKQKTFKDCINFKTGNRLRFDFAIYNKEDVLFCLIEYDGRQHFEPIEYFGGADTFIKTKFRDNIKNQYCKQNNIKLVRIPYWDFSNLEEILKQELVEVINIEK